ncbi:MAG: tRNA (guanosine(46)-N7)-methyltransferase TrmB [Chitinophagaceae bacterium]
MGQKKLKRFAEIATFQHVLEYPENTAGKWNEYFQNNHPIILELACGKGEYTIGLATMHSENNYIGVDVKGNRIWVGAKRALELGMNNAFFLRTQIGMIDKYFCENEVSEIWLPFPDPQLRISKCTKRLTHPIFLRKYKQFLKSDGYIHLKTDSPVLYQFTKLVIEMYHLDLFEDSADIAMDLPQNQPLQIKTHYESLDIAKSNKVHYLKFKINKPLPTELDDELAKRTREIESLKDGAETEEEKKIN